MPTTDTPDALPVLLPAVRHQLTAGGRPATLRAPGRLPDQPGRPVHQGLDRGRAAGPPANGCSRRWCGRRAIGAARCGRRPGTTRSTGSPPRSRPRRRSTAATRSGASAAAALTNEKAYQFGKFARVALRTRDIDYNGRFCMSSAAPARQPRVRHRPRPAVPAGRHRRGRRGDAGRRQPGRHDAAGDAVLRRAAGQRAPSTS